MNTVIFRTTFGVTNLIFQRSLAQPAFLADDIGLAAAEEDGGNYGNHEHHEHSGCDIQFHAVSKVVRRRSR